MQDAAIRKMDISELKSIYKFIEEDFPSSEYAPYPIMYDQIKNGIQEGLIYHRGSTDLAYSISADSNKNRYVLISLFAVAKEERGKGIGTDFIKALQLNYSDKKAIIVEVEKPEISKSDDDYNSKKRRIHFYERLGFYVIPDIDYIIWDVPMHLMVYPINITKEEINQEIFDIMHDIYLDIMGERFISKLKIKKLD